MGLYTKCFMSTSLSKTRAMKFSLDNIHNADDLPVLIKVDIELNIMNQIGRDISSFSGHTEEKEWLLPYGSYVKVVKIVEKVMTRTDTNGVFH